MMDQAAVGHDAIHGPSLDITLADSLPPIAMLLGGVPLLTILAMTAARYVASGTL